MEDHITKECSVMTGKSGKTKTMPVCARGNCKKALIQPITCDKCRNQYCASHRFPSDHNCTPPPAPSTYRPAVSNPFNSVNAKNLNTKATAAGAATMGAVKKVAASAKVASHNLKPASTSSTPAAVDTKPKGPSSHSNPFSKTDRAFPSHPISNDTLTTATNHDADNEPNRTNTKPLSISTPLIDYNAFVPPSIFACA
ncbi:hypothetical protein H0H87_007480 [Tephrocybe sp. NHM501043]|nr:hypothetical protein H0H87_007480 [Tephrocybe sp. NHM501043]